MLGDYKQGHTEVLVILQVHPLKLNGSLSPGSLIYTLETLERYEWGCRLFSEAYQINFSDKMHNSVRQQIERILPGKVHVRVTLGLHGEPVHIHASSSLLLLLFLFLPCVTSSFLSEVPGWS